MKKMLFALVCAVVMFSSCGDDAGKVNDVIVGRVDAIQETVQKVTNFVQGEKYDDAKAYLDSLSVQTTKATEIIGKLDNKSAADFKQSALDFVSMVGAETAPVFNQAIGLLQTDGGSSQANEAIDMINNFIDKVQKQHDVLSEKQKEFADKNNITLY